MNEQAFNDLYEQFVKTGYRGAKSDFKTLMSTNSDAFNEGFGEFTRTGYNGDADAFATLLGVTNPLKKKDSTEIVTEFNSEVGSSDSSETETESTEIPVFDPTTFNFDPNKVTGTDSREDGYRDPMSNIGMYPDQATIDRSMAQGIEDFETTKANIEEERPDVEAQQERERLAELQAREMAEAQALGITSSEGFQSDISKIDAALIDQEEEEVVPFLIDNFKKYGFGFEETGIGDAVIVNSPDGSNTITIDLDPFTNSTEITEAQRLKNFIKNNITEFEEDAPVADEVTQAIRAKNLREVGRTNKGGGHSTTNFQSGTLDGQNIVIPTLFPKDPNSYTSNPLYWDELPFRQALKLAQERGEVFKFDTKEEADDFAAGSWKNVSTQDAEAKAFYDERGLDYNRERKIIDEYQEIKGLKDFLENNPNFKQEDLSPEEQERFSSLYVNGKLRYDYDEVLDEVTTRYEEIKDDYLDDDAELVREEFDLFLAKQHKQSAGRAIQVNRKARVEQDRIEEASLLMFGVKANNLNSIVPKDEQEADLINQTKKAYQLALTKSEKAADVYENSQLYYTMKHDKSAQMEYSDNWSGFTAEIQNGLARGRAGDVILMASMFPELMGGYDLDDPEATKKAAESIVGFLEDRASTKSRVLTRWGNANGFDESWDVISDNPLEWATTLAGQSLAMMAPYGSKIIATTTTTGIGIGAGIGASGFVTGPGGVVTTGAGAATGGIWGFRTGFAATSVAMEYTNAMIEAMSNQGYDITDPESVAGALNDQGVWDEGLERGLKRGIPIAIVDLITAKLAGNLLRTGSVASRGKRIAALTAERLIADPIGEGTGELLAQVNVGDDIDWKEIVAEMGGGIGNNTSNMSINLALEVRSRNDLELATNLTNINFMSKELSTDSQISAWANNMEKLGKIDAETNQLIQQNVGVRKTAMELLQTSKYGKRFRGKNATQLEARVMTLLQAKEELSSTPNRKAVFGPKLKQINSELAEIISTKTLLDPSQETRLAGEGVLSASEQNAGTDLRAGKQTYRIQKGFRGKLGQFTEVSKEEFLNYVNELDPRDLGRLNASIDNDDETAQYLANKMVEAKVAPIQEKLKISDDGSLVVEEGNLETPAAETTTNEAESTTNEAVPTETTTDIVETTAEDGVSSKTLNQEESVLDNDVQAQEVADLEASLDGKKPKVDFKIQTDNENNTDNVGPDEIDITTEINEIESPNVETVIESTEESADINVEELNTRTDNPLKITKLEVIKGIPTIFTISDQLTTGNVVNSTTGNTIDNLKGAVGFNGTTGNENAAWANVTEKEAQTTINKAEQVYQNNKEVFDSWWAANPEYNGLVPMNVVKMGENAMISNEAVSRVLLDNLKTLPESNRKAAIPVLKTEIAAEVVRQQAKAKPTKELSEFQQLQDAIEKLNPKSIDDVFSDKFIQTLPLPVRSHLIRLATTGTANTPNQKSKKAGTVNAKTKAVPQVLLKGVSTKTDLINIGVITDVVTDPQLRNVPIGNVISIVGVDVLNPGVVETTHPNYKYGVRGKSIGILENPQQMAKVYPKAYGKVFSKLIESEKQKTTEVSTDTDKQKASKKKPTSTKTLRAQQTGVGIGIPSFDYVGVIANANPSNVDKLNAFMNISFPGVVINTDANSFNNVMSQDNVTKYLKGNEIVYGVTVDGDIYINPEVHNSESALFNTSIHEMGHVWTDYLQTTEQGKKIYKQGAELVQQTDTFKTQLERFNGDVTKATNEAMAILIGNKGQTIADASVKSKFQEWLLGMWQYIQKKFKLSTDLSEQEIQDLTLDQFLGTALADIFAGKEIKMTNEQMIALKNPEAMFSSDISMESIIQQGREQFINDESIRVVLKNRGFKAKDINNAMVVNIDLTKPLPREFGNVDGGAKVGFKLFNEVREKINEFAFSGSKRVGRGVPERTKSFAEVRQKALDILKANPIFQVQPEQTQLELTVALDRMLGIRTNQRVTKEIGQIKNNLKQRKISKDNIADAQRRMRTIIRKLLPNSKNYSNKAINSLLKTINTTTPKNFVGKVSEVLTQVEAQRLVQRNILIDKIAKLVKKKVKVRKTASGKRRSAGLDAPGQSYFTQVEKVLNAAKKGDLQTIIDLQESINPEAYEQALVDREAGKKLTSKQQVLLDRQLAIDTFGDVLNMDLQQVEDLFVDVKATSSESIANLNNRRNTRREALNEIKEDFKAQIESDYEFLFDEDGNPLNKNQVKTRQEKIREGFEQNGLFGGLRTFFKTFYDGEQLKSNGVVKFLENNIAHLGTIARKLDSNTRGMFTRIFFDRLNDFDENTLKGIRRTESRMNAMSQSTNKKDWTDWKYSLGTETQEFTMINSKTGKPANKRLNKDQAMRLYALSKNTIQGKKLERQKLDIEGIKTFIGPDNVALVDQAVDFLSNSYFEETNDVYIQVNDIGLGFVENYFPTRTIKEQITAEMIGAGQFQNIFDTEFSPAFKERFDKTNDVEIGQSFSEVMEDHVNQMEKYKAYAVGVKEMSQVLKDPSVNLLLEQTGLKGLFLQNLNYAINPDSGPQVSQDVISYLQNRFTGFALALKVVQIPKQASSFVQAFEKYSATPQPNKIPGYDLINFAYDYFKVIATLPRQIKESREISATFDARLKKGLAGDIFGLESGSRTYKSLKADQGRRGRISRGFEKVKGFTTVAGDILGVLGYKAVYNRAIANGMGKAEALRLFNEFNSTQQTRRATEKSPMQQSTNVFNRFFTMFGSSLFLMMNNVGQSGAAILSGKAGKSDYRKFALNYAVANVMFTAMSYAPALLVGKGDERDRALRALRDAALGLNLLYSVPILGAAIESAVAKATGDRKPISDGVNPLTSVVRKIDKARKEIKEDGSVLAVVQPIFEIIAGMQLDAPIGVAKILGGDFADDNIYDATGVTPSYRPGYGTKKKKTTTKKKKTSKADLKLIDPELFEEIYGKGSDVYEIKQEMKDLRKELREEMKDY